jgi:hypothetical protein
MTPVEAARIAAAAAILRPSWHSQSVKAAITDPHHLTVERPAQDVAAAIAWLALDPDTNTPGRIHAAGPWWPVLRPEALDPVVAPTPAEHRRRRPDASARACPHAQSGPRLSIGRPSNLPVVRPRLLRGMRPRLLGRRPRANGLHLRTPGSRSTIPRCGPNPPTERIGAASHALQQPQPGRITTRRAPRPPPPPTPRCQTRRCRTDTLPRMRAVRSSHLNGQTPRPPRRSRPRLPPPHRPRHRAGRPRHNRRRPRPPRLTGRRARSALPPARNAERRPQTQTVTSCPQD